jgi:Metallo-beta-lactamase superfamily
MRSEKALLTSRREFLSNALGMALVPGLTWPTRAGQACFMLGQFDSSPSNTGRTSQKVPLSWDVFLAPSIPAITSDLPPGEKERPWPPISSTLISGERDAVLADTPISVEQARALANWVVATGKNLTTIYASHGHGDHFFGTSTVLERFPGARFVARPDVIKVMRQQASPESLATFWNPRFPGQISSHLAIPEELTGNVINLEGHDLVSVPLGFTDTANTTCLHVPAIGLVVAVMPHTTAFTCICQSRPISKSAKSGLLLSIKWRRLSHAQSSPGTSASGTMTVPRSWAKRGNISAISGALPCRRQPLRSYMTKC